MLQQGQGSRPGLQIAQDQAHQALLEQCPHLLGRPDDHLAQRSLVHGTQQHLVVLQEVAQGGEGQAAVQEIGPQRDQHPDLPVTQRHGICQVGDKGLGLAAAAPGILQASGEQLLELIHEQ